MPGRYSAHKLRFNRYHPAPPEPVPCRNGRNFLCLGKYNGPFCKTRAAGKPAALGAECIAPAFLRLLARNAPWLLPGDGLSHPEHGGPGRIPTGDRNGSGGSPLAGGLIHDRLGHHLMNGRRQPGEDAGCKIARMMIRSKNIGEVPMDGAVHTSSPHSYSVPKAGEKPWKNNPDTPPAYEEMEGKGKI